MAVQCAEVATGTGTASTKSMSLTTFARWKIISLFALARDVFGAELVGKKRKHYYEESEEGKGSFSIVD